MRLPRLPKLIVFVVLGPVLVAMFWIGFLLRFVGEQKEDRKK